MHPELSLQIARLRHAELTDPRRLRHAADRGGRRRLFFRRRRDTHQAAATAPAALALLPPPREELDAGLVA